MWWLIVIVLIIGLGFHPLQVRMQAAYSDKLDVTLYWIPLRWINKKVRVVHLIVPPQDDDKGQSVQDETLGELTLRHADGSPVSAEELAAQIAANDAKRAQFTASKDNAAEDKVETEGQNDTAKQGFIQSRLKKLFNRLPVLQDNQQRRGTQNDVDVDISGHEDKIPLRIIIKYIKKSKCIMHKLLRIISLHRFDLNLSYGGDIMMCALGAGTIYASLGSLLGFLSTKLRHCPAYPEVNINWQAQALNASLDIEVSTNLFLVINFAVYAIIKIDLFGLLRDVRNAKAKQRAAAKKKLQVAQAG